MRTLAIWYKENSGNTEQVNLDLHFNFWKIRKKTNNIDEYFLDIGLMVQEITNVSSIYIFFPFNETEFEIEDLGEILIKHHELIGSIFNENYSINKIPEIPKQIRINYKGDGKPLFDIYALDINNNDAELSEQFEGTKLHIPVNKFKLDEQCDNFYFRFRLKGAAIGRLIKHYKPKNWFFQSAFSEVETIDFRVNEKRNYSESLKEDVASLQEFNIKKIHFLLLRNANDDFLSSHIKASCRELEASQWKNYVGRNHLLEDIFAYHWSEKAKGDDNIDSFNTLAKIRYHKSNFKTISMYLIMLALLSICFNIASGYLKESLDSLLNNGNVVSEDVINGSEGENKGKKTITSAKPGGKNE